MKIILIILISFVSLFGSAYCQQKNNKDSTVFKQMLDSVRLNTNEIYDDKGRWTTDLNQIFSKEQIIKIDSIVSNIKKEKNIDILLVKYWGSSLDFESAAENISRIWELEKQNCQSGIIIEINTLFKELKLYKGYGLDTKIMESKTKEMVEKVAMPEFKHSNFYEGTFKAIMAIISN